MIRARLQIAGGDILDMYTQWGFVQAESDTRYSAPIKERQKTSYIDEEGEHIDRRTTKDAFDYKITFLVEAKNYNLDTANHKIAEFNKQLYATNGDIEEYFEVTLYNDFKHCKIVGTPSPMTEATDFYRHNGVQYEWAQVEWTIRVHRPSLCDFDLEA
jgi:DNA-dependent RNA polymerase auxiliary subunit epsilon